MTDTDQPALISPGMTFAADEVMRTMFPDDERWTVIRDAPFSILVADKVIDNRRGNKWWCSPVGGEGQVELLCCFDVIKPGFFESPK